MKKILAVLLAVVLVMSAASVSALAATPYITPGIRSDADLPLCVGETVTVTVSIEETSGYTGLSLELDYDSEVFELIEATDLGTVSGAFPTPYDYTMFWTNPLVLDDFTYTGPIAEFVLEVIDTPDDESTVSVIIDDVVNGVPEDGVGGSAFVSIPLEYDSFTECDHVYGDEVLLLAPSCSMPGYKGRTCTECGYVLAEEIPATGEHVWDDGTVTKEPTATETGIKTYYCTNPMCETSKTEEIPATGSTGHSHSYNDGVVTTEATCTEDGVKTFTCSDCGETKTEVIPALGHDIEEYDAKAATCTEAGHTAYEACTRCDYTTCEEVPATGHAWKNGDVVLEATCTEDGTRKVYCENCSETYTTGISALGHDIVKNDAKAATCTEAGYAAYETCSRCDYTTYEEIAAVGHTYESSATESTCENGGVITYTCSGCGDTYTETVDALGHDIVKHEAKAATCTEVGYNAYETCSRCDYTTYEEIPAAGHTLVTVPAQAATCTEAGWAEYEKCEVCDYSTYEEIAAVGHAWGDGVITTEATCTEDGVKTFACSVCGETKTEVIPALGHSFGDDAVTVPATCTESGSVTGTCSVCEQVATQVIEPTGHVWDDGEVTKEATTTEVGEKTYHCTVCEETKTEEIPVIENEETNTPSSGSQSGSGSSGSSSDAPKTGDDSAIGLWITLTAVCLVAFVAVLAVAKKKNGHAN